MDKKELMDENDFDIYEDDYGWGYDEWEEDDELDDININEEFL